jgi:hypothetical protein
MELKQAERLEFQVVNLPSSARLGMALKQHDPCRTAK